MGGAHLHNQGTLPPPDARLIDPHAPDFLPLTTPVDERGIINIDSLIDQVKATVDPCYTWPKHASVHHFYWPESWYKIPYTEPRENPTVFRNLPINKGLVPRVFENWLHQITIPPVLPEREVRACTVEAWLVARDLFLMARKTVQWQRIAERRRQLISENPTMINEGFNGSDVIGEEIMHEIFEKNFRGVTRHLERNAQLPEAFRLLPTSNEPATIAQALGKIIVPRSLKLVNRVAA